MNNITNINFNDLIPNFRVYYRDGDEIIARTIEYIKNPDEANPNIRVELDQLPNPLLQLDLDDLNNFENQPQETDPTKKIIIIKFIGEEDEETGNVHLNDNNKVTILVMTDETNNFLFEETELQKPIQKKRGKAGGKRKSSKKRGKASGKKKLSKKQKLFRKKK